MQVMVLGAGLQGVACAFDLLQRTEAKVTLVDNKVAECPPLLRPFDADRLIRKGLDVSHEGAVADVMQGHDAVASALPYYFNFDMARLAVEAGVHFADLGGNTELVRQQETLNDRAVERGVTVVPDCGLAPGMVNILARDGIEALDSVDSVRMYVGGLPRHPEPPLNYQIVYSLEGAFDYYTTRSWVLRDGSPMEVEALTEVEQVEFREPIGQLEAFHTAGGLSTMPWDFVDSVQTMEYKTLRYPGHVHIMKAIRDLGLLDNEPIDVKGTPVVPRDVFIATVDGKLRRPGSPDLVALKVISRGQKNGLPATRTHTLLDYHDDENGISAMMRATAYSLSITSQMQIEGTIHPAGVRPAYRATPAAAYMDALRDRGVVIEVVDGDH